VSLFSFKLKTDFFIRSIYNNSRMLAFFFKCVFGNNLIENEKATRLINCCKNFILGKLIYAQNMPIN